MLADIYLAITKTSYLKGIESAIGAELRDVNAAPPRMVWVPTATEYLPGNSWKPDSRTGKLAPTVRREAVAVRVWGKDESSDEAVDDIRATEKLVNRLLYAVSLCAKGSVHYGGATWVEAVEDSLLPTPHTTITKLPPDALTGTLDFPPQGDSTKDITGTPAP